MRTIEETKEKLFHCPSCKYLISYTEISSSNIRRWCPSCGKIELFEFLKNSSLSQLITTDTEMIKLFNEKHKKIREVTKKIDKRFLFLKVAREYNEGYYKFIQDELSPINPCSECVVSPICSDMCSQRMEFHNFVRVLASAEPSSEMSNFVSEIVKQESAIMIRKYGFDPYTQGESSSSSYSSSSSS